MERGKVMKRKMSIFAILVFVAMLGTMVACGGGGGGSEAVSYDGSTMPSVIDTTASVALAKAAALSHDAAFDASPVSPASAGAAVLRVPSNPMDMVAFARGIIAGGSVSGAVEPLAAVESLSYSCSTFTDYDGSGGSRTAQFCEDGDRVKITMSADGYDDGDVAYDGVVIIEGTETGGGTIIFRDFFSSSVSDNEDLFIDGIITFRDSGSTATVTFNVSMYDYVTEEGFWIDNYRAVVVEDTGNSLDTVTITGRFYDYHDGYVDISTVTPVVVPWNQDYPILGELQMTGAMGYWIKIRFDQDISDVPILQVEVNIDEDPDWDWQSAWEYWEPIT